MITLLKILVTVVLSVAVIQIGAVYLLRFVQPELNTTELVAIMSGSNDRISYGCMIAAGQGSGSLMLSSSSLDALKTYAARYKVPDSVTLLPVGKSRSSFEDVHIIVQTARERNLSSVITVTSDYHLPRALCLMHLYRLFSGQELHIQYLAVREDSRPHTRFWQFYSEIVKFWGSVVEMSGYLLTGQLPLDSERVRVFRDKLKSMLLLVE